MPAKSTLGEKFESDWVDFSAKRFARKFPIHSHFFWPFHIYFYGSNQARNDFKTNFKIF